MNIVSRPEAEIAAAVRTTIPVAVVGIGCRLPGGITGPESYWNFLLRKQCGIVEVPADRWNVGTYYTSEHDVAGKSRSKWGGFLTQDVFGFDPAFFDMSPREAQSMDPQQRMLLQIAYEAIQDGRTTIDALQRVRTGVFVGISTTDFAFTQRLGRHSQDIFAGTGSAMSIAANRISHRFDLTGPSLSIDTACSSALVAVDQAVRHLTLGSCDLALAGGVNCLLDPGGFIAFSSANMLSPTGAIYSFDERANGFVRGEGCGLVLLKPLDRAIADQDRIYAVIRGTAVNQDGFTPTLTAPSETAQTQMLQSLVARAGVDPEDVGFVEAHGTGTPVGDPIEARAIGRVFGSRRIGTSMPVGSFKPNLGHLESASGIAGLIKIVLSAANRTVAPNRNFEKPNPHIPFDLLGIHVPVNEAPLADEGRSALAVVNSFGFGGTNASVLVEGGGRMRAAGLRAKPRAAAQDIPTSAPVPITLSAGSKTALALWATNLARDLEAGGALDSVSYDRLAMELKRRDHLAERAVVLADPTAQDLPRKLRAVASGADLSETENKAGPTVITGRASARRRLAFTFSGQGGQWWAMGRRLLVENPLYRRTVDEFDEALRPLCGWSVVDEMLRSQEDSRINDPDTTQASIFANEIGLFEVWKARGLTPELLLGHSFGEVAATFVAGVIDMDTAARIIHNRGLIPDQSERRGAMASVGLTVEELMPLLPADGSVGIAAFNGPTAQTISGLEEPVLATIKVIAERHPDALLRRHTMNFGWHGPHLDDCEAWFRRELGSISWKAPSIPIVSTVTGRLETCFDLEYWWQNLRLPVSFKKAIDFTFDLGIDTYLELGPHRTLTPLIHGLAQERGVSAVAVTSLDRTADDFWTMERSAARLYVSGVTFDWDAPAYERTHPPVPLPALPWTNERLLQRPMEAEQILFQGPKHPLLGWRDIAPEPIWTHEISLKSHKYLTDHRVSGDCLYPAVGYVEMMIAALQDYFGAGRVELRDLKILEALSIGDDDTIILKTTFDPITHRVRIASMRRGSDDGWRLRAQAYGWRHDFKVDDPGVDLSIIEASPAMSRDEFYRLTRLHGLEYGPAFQSMQGVWLTGERSALCRVVSEEAAARPGFTAFPGLLDAVLQSGIPISDVEDGYWTPGSPLPEDDGARARFALRLPVGIRKVLATGPLPSEVFVRFEGKSDERTGTYRIYSPDGELLFVIDELYTKSLGSAARAAVSPEVPVVVEESFIAIPEAPAAADLAATGQRWALITSDDAAAAAIGAGSRIVVERLDYETFAAMDPTAAAEAIQALTADAGGLAGLLFVDGRHTGDAVADEAFADRIGDSTCALIAVGQALDRLRALPTKPRLVVVTRGARCAPDDPAMEPAGVAGSVLIGLTRTIANECQEFRVTQIDAGDLATDAATLVATVIEGGPETEILVRGARRYAARLDKKVLDVVSPRKRRIATASDPSNYMVTMSAPGVIDNIVLRETAIPEPRAGEVVVEVAAVGLNFRDVMVATSILPDEVEGDDAWWRNLGLEFSGVVRSVGAGVSDLSVGDRVMGMGKGYLRRYARVYADTAMRVPDGIDLVAAATMPAAFLTAHYALEHVGRLSEGEKVLIHLATGGVGLAAIQVARFLGADILGTAGSDRKRQHLKDLGIAQVMHSRTLDFAEDVRKATGGRGVDVVLNALSGSAIDKGLECLAPFGRFVEIGKRDLADDKPIGLKSLYYNNSYSVIDLSTFGAERPLLLRRLLREVAGRIAEGAYKPLTLTTFPVSRTAEAMRTLAKAEHIGKVVVVLDEAEVEVELDASRPAALSPDASYLVTGGLRGFGVKLAEWLSLRGAGRLLLVGRAGQVDPSAQETIDAIKARGTEVVAAALDVSDAAAVSAFIDAHAHDDKPLRGVIHGAAVIEDGFLSQLSRAQIERVLRPKAAGAWYLHQAIERAGITLDIFMSCSSLAQFIGSAGQASYTAANSVLNALASYRRDRGLSATTVAWGAIGGSGFVSRSDALGSYLDSIGMKTIADTTAAEALDRLLCAQSPYLVYAGVDWSVMGRALPRASADPRLKPLLVARSDGRSRIQAELAASPRAAWEGMLVDLIRGEVAKVLKVDPKEIPTDRKLSELGLDSLSSFELKNRIEAQVDINIPVAKFLQTPTVAGLSKVVAATLEAMLKAQAAQAARIAAGGDASGGGAGGEALRPLIRQTALVNLDRQPMTSDIARTGLVLSASRPCPASVGFEALAAAVATFAATADGVRLWAQDTGAGAFEVVMGEAPVLSLVDTVDEIKPIALPGPLWSFAAVAHRDGLQLHVRAHRAAADAASLQIALSGIVDAARGETTDVGCFTRFANEQALTDGSPEQVSHLAFWMERLRDAPSLIENKRRLQAPAPAGTGINAGPCGVLSARIPLPEFMAAPGELQEAIALAAFARALGRAHGKSAVLIERHDPWRGDLSAPRVVGPAADAFPVLIDDLRAAATLTVQRARHNLKLASARRRMDTFAIEAALKKELREGNIALRQIGFAFVGDAPALADGAAQLPPFNELRLELGTTPDAVTVRLVVDVNAFDAAYADKLVSAMAGELGACVSSAADPDILDRDWAEPRQAFVRFAAPAVVAPATDAPEVPASRGLVLPVSSAQESMLRSLLRPDATDAYRAYWSISRAFRIRPALDVARLERAVAAVVQRHEGLRTQFVQDAEGRLSAVILPDREGVFRVESWEGRPEADVIARVGEITAALIDPFAEPLYQITVLRTGEDGDVIVTRGHLAVADGWSMSLLLEDFFQCFIGIELDPIEMDTTSYLQIIDGPDAVAMREKRDAYLRGLYSTPVPLPKFGRAKRGLPANTDMVLAGPSRALTSYLTAEGQAGLKARARGVGATESTLLMAAFAQVLGERGDVDEVILTVPVAMRTERRTHSFVGYLAGSTLLRARVRDGRSVEDLALELGQQLNASTELAPFNYAFRDGEVHDEIVRAGSYLAMFWTGMQTIESFSRGVTGQFVNLDATGGADFGLLKIESVKPAGGHMRTGAPAMDLRSFQGPDGLAYRCAYDETEFDEAEARALFGDVLERLGLGIGGAGPINAAG